MQSNAPLKGSDASGRPHARGSRDPAPRRPGLAQEKGDALCCGSPNHPQPGCCHRDALGSPGQQDAQIDWCQQPMRVHPGGSPHSPRGGSYFCPPPRLSWPRCGGAEMLPGPWEVGQRLGPLCWGARAPTGCTRNQGGSQAAGDVPDTGQRAQMVPLPLGGVLGLGRWQRSRWARPGDTLASPSLCKGGAQVPPALGLGQHVFLARNPGLGRGQWVSNPPPREKPSPSCMQEPPFALPPLTPFPCSSVGSHGCSIPGRLHTMR